MPMISFWFLDQFSCITNNQITIVVNHFFPGICLSIPQYLTSAHHVGPRAAPPGDWWVLVIGMSKTFDNQVSDNQSCNEDFSVWFVKESIKGEG